jgi:hypothetical protein
MVNAAEQQQLPRFALKAKRSIIDPKTYVTPELDKSLLITRYLDLAEKARLGKATKLELCELGRVLTIPETTQLMLERIRENAALTTFIIVQSMTLSQPMIGERKNKHSSKTVVGAPVDTTDAARGKIIRRDCYDDDGEDCDEELTDANTSTMEE